jgi:hypothetical protein
MPPSFKGRLSVDVRDSVPDWEPYTPPRAPRLHVDDEVQAEGTSPGTFTGGTIFQVEINVGDDQYIDLEQEAMAALAR